MSTLVILVIKHLQAGWTNTHSVNSVNTLKQHNVLWWQ